MKKLITRLALVSALALSTVALAGPHDDMEPGKRMDRMQKELNLNDQQRSQIEAIFQDHHKEMTRLRESTEQKINGVLTEEQRSKFDGIREERRERFKDKFKDRRENSEHKGKGKRDEYESKRKGREED